MLKRMKKFVEEDGIFGASMAMVWAGLADSKATLDNVREYGIDIEKNPLVRGLIGYAGEEFGVYLPKVLASLLAIYTAKRMNESGYKIRGEYLLYGAAAYWSIGALLNLIV